MKILSIVLMLAGYSLLASANDVSVCTQAEKERRIEVVYLQDAKVPCEVHYVKDGETETLWAAQSEEGYCESKAQEFVEKQKAWGWECLSENK